MDLATAQTMLDGWLAVETRLMSGQSYTLPESGVQRVDARQVTQKIQYWQRVVDGYTATAAGATPSIASLASFS